MKVASAFCPACSLGRLLASVGIEADYNAEAWALYDDKEQIRAIQIAFDEFHHCHPKEPR
jgi:hypothetical protein